MNLKSSACGAQAGKHRFDVAEDGHRLLMHALNGAAVALDAHAARAADLTGIIHATAGFADGFAVLLELTTDLFKFGHCQKPPFRAALY